MVRKEIIHLVVILKNNRLIRPDKKDIALGGFLITTSLLLVPVFTLWFGTLHNPFNYTLSMIGNRFDRMTEFIVWGFITGLLLVIFISHLHKKAAYSDKRSRRLLIYSNIFLVLTCATPAVEEINAFTHKLHAVFGALFAICLSVSLFFFIKYLRGLDEDVSGKSMRFLLLIVFGSLSLLIIFGNSGIFELFFFITLSIFLYFLKRWIR